jgi:MFS transporter, FSR family, fosmidomycin resistance protein
MARSKNVYVIVYAVIHALVDLVCAGVLLSQYDTSDTRSFVIALIVYNVIAFGSQPIFGLITDRYKNPVFMAILGSLIVGSSVFMMNMLLLSAVVAGIGNAIFHIGGGVVSLRMAKGKATIPGLFVAPGTIGLFVGSYLGKANLFTPHVFLALLLIGCAIMYYLDKPKEFKKKEFSHKTSCLYPIAGLILFSILIRAFIGKSIYLDWRFDIQYGILLASCIFIGKAIGGVVADVIGWEKVAVGGLLISAPMLSFGIGQSIIFSLGVLFFNMTMPVTLIALANILPNRHGLAFGLTTLAIIIGALPAFAGFSFVNKPIILAIAFLSALVLYSALRLYERK